MNQCQPQRVKEFKYLVSLVQENKVASTPRIYDRIGQSAIAFALLKWCIQKKTNMYIKAKMQLFRMLILPVLLYGIKTWLLLKSALVVST